MNDVLILSVVVIVLSKHCGFLEDRPRDKFLAHFFILSWHDAFLKMFKTNGQNRSFLCHFSS